MSLACGDTSAKAFTVTPANIPNGATLTYNWSYSSSGWSGSSSNTNSITLSPSSGSNLPTNVSVTPVLNGVAQPTKTCIVTRAPFTQTAAIISGANSICTPATSGVYSISNQGTNTVTWSSSNTTIATVSSTTGTSITVNKVSNGTFNLVARITNTCGQYLDVTKSVRVGGLPSGLSVIATTNANDYDLQLTWPTSTPNGLTSVTWTKYSGNGTCGGSGVIGWADGSPTIAWTVTIKITATNDCGSTIIYKTYTNPDPDHDPHTKMASGKSDSSDIYKIFPNPSNEIINIALSDENKIPKSNSKISAILYDLKGRERKQFEIENNKATINAFELEKGIYILKINIDGIIESHKISVE